MRRCDCHALQSVHGSCVDGSVRWIATAASFCDAAGEPLYVTGAAADITELKEIDEQRQRLVTVAEQARAQSERERLRAETANRMKDEFLATVSHELRTPLTAILGWSRILRDTQFDRTRVEKGIEIIERNARAQVRIVEDILDVSRIITGKVQLDLRRLNVAGMLEAAVNTVSSAASARDVALQVTSHGALGELLGDSERLQQVLWNLLSNAIKFTPAGGKVELGATRSDGRSCCPCVTRPGNHALLAAVLLPVTSQHRIILLNTPPPRRTRSTHPMAFTALTRSLAIVPVPTTHRRPSFFVHGGPSRRQPRRGPGAGPQPFYAHPPERAHNPNLPVGQPQDTEQPHSSQRSPAHPLRTSSTTDSNQTQSPPEPGARAHFELVGHPTEQSRHPRAGRDAPRGSGESPHGHRRRRCDEGAARAGPRRRSSPPPPTTARTLHTRPPPPIPACKLPQDGYRAQADPRQLSDEKTRFVPALALTPTPAARTAVSHAPRAASRVLVEAIPRGNGSRISRAA
jgi:hypothetical protein